MCALVCNNGGFYPILSVVLVDLVGLVSTVCLLDLFYGGVSCGLGSRGLSISVNRFCPSIVEDLSKSVVCAQYFVYLLWCPVYTFVPLKRFTQT